MKISETARKTKLSKKAIRYYEQKDLMMLIANDDLIKTDSWILDL